jgi:hypothetical protein
MLCLGGLGRSLVHPRWTTTYVRCLFAPPRVLEAPKRLSGSAEHVPRRVAVCGRSAVFGWLT